MQLRTDGLYFSSTLRDFKMRFDSLAVIGLFASSALAVPKVKRAVDPSQPINDSGKGAPLLGEQLKSLSLNNPQRRFPLIECHFKVEPTRPMIYRTRISLELLALTMASSLM